MKKLKSMLVTLAMLLCTISASAHDFEVDGIYYNITDSEKLTVEVTYRGDSYSSYSNEYTGNVIILETIIYDSKTYSVTSISNSAFYNCRNLTSVTIPNGVTSIGNSAFYNCSSLNSAIIPDGVTSIGNSAFYGCNKLSSVSIPNSVTNIKAWAFQNCNGLTSVHISNIAAWCNIKFDRSETNPLSYAKHLYMNGQEITELIIPDGVTDISSYAFCNCSNITSISIPNSVTSIGTKAFWYCSNLTSINIPNSVTYIGNYAFAGTSWYNNQTDGLIYIGKVAYKYKGTMPSYTSLELKEGTLGIAHSAFYDCSGLESITIPNSIKSISEYAFYGCNSLSSVIIPNSVTNIGNYAFERCSSLSSVVIPNSVTSIGKGSFQYCSGLTSVTIPNSISSIPDYAFWNCSKLSSIIIPSSVTSIGYLTFAGCSGLISVNIPNSVTNIGTQAFMDCRNLTTVTIGNKVKSIDTQAFYECTALKAVHISDISAWCNIEFQYDTNPLKYAGHLYLDGEEIKDLVIPAGTTKISDNAFLGCVGLTSITIPSSVTDIGQLIIQGCDNISSIKVENNPIYDSRNNCNAIIETETNSLLIGCKNTIIPENVESIGSNAFNNCYNLTSIIIPHSVKNIGILAFKECSKLSNVSIGNGVTSIGDEAFYDCFNLKSLKIGNNVTDIGRDAFYGCSSLTSIVIPNGVTNIHGYGFEGNRSLIDVYCLSETVPLAESYCFGNSSSINATLYVPASSINAYKSTEPWSYFETIKALPAHEIVMNNNISTYCYPYDLDFTNVEGLKAYIASTYDDVNEKVQMTRINKVPAETGIILTGNAGNYNVAYATSKVATDFTNLLKGVTTATIIGPSSDGFLNYILSKGTNGIGFYPAKEGTLAAGKAYLQLSSSVSSAKGISMSFDDETTGIMDNYDVGTMNSDVAVYDLQGRKVKNPTKGLYIVNGKKIMIK